MSTLGARTSYPTGDDLIYLLQSAGLDQLTDESAYELLKGACDSYMEASVDDFEEVTHFQPFLSDGTDSTRYYTPIWSPANLDGRLRDVGLLTNRRGDRRRRDNVLELDGGLTDVPTQVMTEITYDSTGTEQAGTVRVRNFDYILGPENAPARKKPYRYIQFYCALQGGLSSVKVTGPFGFTQTLTENVWRDILAGGADRLRAEGALQITGGESEVSIGTLRVKFNREGILKQFDDWRVMYQATVERYTRKDLGFY